MTDDGRLEGPPDVLARLAAEGVATVGDVLARAETVRELPDRSNHVLRVGADRFHVKRSRRRGPSREAAAIALARKAGVPTAMVAFAGRVKGAGSLVGTFDLAPARPLDDLLREGALSVPARDAAFRALAEATAALHRARLHHHDLYLSHVFVDPTEARPAVTLIDLERVTSHHGLLGRAIVKDLAAIEASIPDGIVSCEGRARFLAHYLRSRHFPVRSLLGPLLRRVVRKAALIRRHVPRTPVGEAARPGPPGAG